MSFYRTKAGVIVEAVKFNGGKHAELAFGSSSVDWIVNALNAKIIELSAFGFDSVSLVLHFRGASYGLAKDDWLIRLPGEEITHCRGDKFAAEYEAV